MGVLACCRVSGTTLLVFPVIMVVVWCVRVDAPVFVLLLTVVGGGVGWSVVLRGCCGVLCENCIVDASIFILLCNFA